MLRTFSAIVLVAGLAAFSTSGASAFPANGAAITLGEDAASLVQDARVFCYNRASGRFLHWGRCGGGYGGYNRPRIYCKNRYTGRFLHWGSCY